MFASPGSLHGLTRGRPPGGAPARTAPRRWAAIALGALLGWVATAGADIVVTNCTPAALAAALAQNQAAGGGRVVFPPGRCDLVLTQTLHLAGEVELDGLAGEVTLQGNGTFRLLVVESNAVVTLSGLRFARGQHTNGGALFIAPGAQVRITECVFENNSATGPAGSPGSDGRDNPSGIGGNGGNGAPGGHGWGGAIFNLGDLQMEFTQFTNNRAVGGNGGRGGNGGNGEFAGGNGGNGGNGGLARGGAVYNAGRLQAFQCSFEANEALGGHAGRGGTNGAGTFPGRPGTGGAGGAAGGAALYSVQPVELASCTFALNYAEGGDSADAGVLSTGVGGNGPKGGDALGGAVHVAAAGTGLTNCTLYANGAVGGNGGNGGTGDFGGGNGGDGGLASGGGLYAAGHAELRNCTVALNGVRGGTNGVAGGGTWPGVDGKRGGSRGGGVAGAAGTLVLRNTLLATNSPGGDGFGTIADGGYNLSTDGSIAWGSTSRSNVHPRLAELADNGGFTRTMALQPDSPAIDAGNNATSPATDQRGVARPVGVRSDVGAFEFAWHLQGRILQGNQGVPGILVQAGSAVAVTDVNGDYSLPVSPGNYRVRPVATDFEFSPPEQIVSVSSNLTGVNFSAVSLFALGGRVVSNAVGQAGVTVSLGAQTTVTDAQGYYRFFPLYAGEYAVTVSRPGFEYEPPVRFVVLGPSITNADFVSVPLFRVAGRVVEGQQGLAEVVVAADDRTAVTDAEGYYVIAAVRPGTYFVYATRDGFAFEPQSQEVIVGPDQTNVNFAVAHRIYTLSGRVTFTNAPLAGVRIFTDGFGSPLTDSAGRYTLRLPPGTYTVSPRQGGLGFHPALRTVTLPPDVTDADFEAGAVVAALSFTPEGWARLSLIGLGTLPMRLEASADLQQWETLHTGSGVFQFTDTDAANFLQRFYRLVWP